MIPHQFLTQSPQQTLPNRMQTQLPFDNSFLLQQGLNNFLPNINNPLINNNIPFFNLPDRQLLMQSQINPLSPMPNLYRSMLPQNQIYSDLLQRQFQFMNVFPEHQMKFPNQNPQPNQNDFTTQEASQNNSQKLAQNSTKSNQQVIEIADDKEEIVKEVQNYTPNFMYKDPFKTNISQEQIMQLINLQKTLLQSQYMGRSQAPLYTFNEQSNMQLIEMQQKLIKNNINNLSQKELPSQLQIKHLNMQEQANLYQNDKGHYLKKKQLKPEQIEIKPIEKFNEKDRKHKKKTEYYSRIEEKLAKRREYVEENIYQRTYGPSFRKSLSSLRNQPPTPPTIKNNDPLQDRKTIFAFEDNSSEEEEKIFCSICKHLKIFLVQKNKCIRLCENCYTRNVNPSYQICYLQPNHGKIRMGQNYQADIPTLKECPENQQKMQIQVQNIYSNRIWTGNPSQYDSVLQTMSELIKENVNHSECVQMIEAYDNKVNDLLSKLKDTSTYSLKRQQITTPLKFSFNRMTRQRRKNMKRIVLERKSSVKE